MREQKLNSCAWHWFYYAWKNRATYRTFAVNRIYYNWHRDHNSTLTTYWIVIIKINRLYFAFNISFNLLFKNILVLQFHTFCSTHTLIYVVQDTIYEPNIDNPIKMILFFFLFAVVCMFVITSQTLINATWTLD